MAGSRLPEPIPFIHSHPTLALLNQIGRSLSLSQKKEVMTAVRVGLAPRRSRRLRKQKAWGNMRKDPVILRDLYGNRVEEITMHDVWFLLDSYLTTPVRRSLLSMALRCSPILDKSEATSAVTTGIEKELAVTQRLDLLPSVRYPFLISRDECLTTRMHPDIPHRPHLLLQLRQRFLHIRVRIIPNLLLVPQVSAKSVGLETSEKFWEAVYPSHGSWNRPRRKITTIDLEALYQQEGIRVEGPCEVRYAWKYNDLKPRVYYAIGGSAFHAAKYIKPIFDAICKISRSTDPTHRYSFAGFPLLDFTTEIFIIYDYASFTSRLVDFKKWVEDLAWFFRGTRVKTFDTNRGIVEEDAGALLHHYNAICNIDGEYSLTAMSTNPGEAPTRVLCNHYVAGMLGVFGNIVGSTGLHGIVGLQICGSDENGNFIGDDAGMVCEVDKEEGREWILAGVRSIGEIADPKFEIFEANDESYDFGDNWHFTKRPIKVTEGGISHSWMPEFPILAQARGQKLDHVTAVLPEITIRRRIFIRQVARFLNSCFRHKAIVNDIDRDLVLSIFRKCYAELRLPVQGAFPRREYLVGPDSHRPYGDPFCFVPPLVEAVFEEGWWSVMKRTALEESGTFRLPVLEGADDLPAVLEAGISFRYRGDKVLSLLDRIGVVSKRIEYQDRLVTEETLELMDLYLSGTLRPVYTYFVNVDYHPWTSYFDSQYPLH